MQHIIDKANTADGECPRLGEVWQQLNGEHVRVVEILGGTFPAIRVDYIGPLQFAAGLRCLDGREVILGRRGRHPLDLMVRISGPGDEAEGVK
jgi:hypothetical protein